MEISSTLLLILMIIFIGSLIRSAMGFGEAVVGMPLLALIIDVKSATPIIALTASTLALFMLISSWNKVNIRESISFILSTIIGLPIGLYYLKNTPDSFIKLVLGILLIGFGIYNLTVKNLPYLRNDRYSFYFGFFAGILGGAYNTNGPPTVIYGVLRRWKRENFRATLQGIFFPTGILINIGHGISGLWTDFVISSYLLALPVIIVALLIGSYLNSKLNEELFKKIIYCFIILIGFILIINSI